MDTSDVKKFFALWKEDDQEKEDTPKVRVMVTFASDQQNEVSGAPVHMSTSLTSFSCLPFFRTWMRWIWRCWLLTYPWTMTSS